MSLDISAILPVSMGQSDSRSLNDDFAATTPSGDSVFGKCIGDKCTWKTPTGSIHVAFLFDPKQNYERHNILASVSSDYMTDIRDQLTKVLLKPEDIACKTKNYEETYWDTVTSTLPKETLAKNVFSKPEKLEEYMKLLETNIKASFREEELLTEALKTQQFSFAYEMAIDAYPQEMRGKKQVAGRKTGVLTIFISSEKDKDTENENKTNSSPEPTTKKRKLNESVSSPTAEKDKSDRQKMLENIGVTELPKTSFNIKTYPLTATLFFEAIGRWFASNVQTAASKLEKARNRNPIYQ